MLRRWASASAKRIRAWHAAQRQILGGDEAAELELELDGGAANSNANARKSRALERMELDQYLKIFAARDEPFDVDTYQHAIQLCTKLRARAEGAAIHAHIRRSRMEAERFVGNDLVFMYAALGDPTEARRIFDNLGSHNILSFTAMMRAYVAARDPDAALKIFHLARLKAFRADPSMLAMAVDAAGMKRDLELGFFLHETIRRSGFQRDPGVGVALIRMYARCGRIEAAAAVLDSLRDLGRVLVWNAAVEAFVESGDRSRALRTLREMILEGLPLSASSFRAALAICRAPEDLAIARLIHSCIVESNLGVHRRDLAVELVRAYGARCGRLDEALQIFRGIYWKDLDATKAMIQAYLAHGRGAEALEEFLSMVSRKIVPDEEVFVLALESRPDLKHCKMIHALLVWNEVEIAGRIRDKLVTAYGSTRPGRDGVRTLTKIHERVLRWARRKRIAKEYVHSYFDFQD